LKKHIVSYIFFLTGLIDIIISINDFSINKIFLGVIYLFLAIAFVALGFRYRKKENGIK